ncbi:serine/threonine protein phosphatase 1 [Flavobacterium gossypii]|uniref:Serine/threonine protein phosphatase 1 n=1 Tax=Flavobacterium gossypii TaxID=1646119 RepID=A0ABR6DNL5_9FLAO|nr:metallophosphoesterase family protein [Flavobacterium gossypii]MBA9073269.1 serine/threonine protein phosphatase 1 [Flavobacterium gossypii]
MNRTLIIGDIHGALKALHQIFKRADVTNTDTLIFLGDYVDGWSESPEVIDFLIALKTTHNCIFLKGNHDDLLLQWLEAKKDNPQWFNHGGRLTMEKYNLLSQDEKQVHIDFLKTLENYHLDEHNRLFIHAGFTNLNGVTYEYFPKMFYWERTLWENALSLDSTIEKDSPYYPKRFNLYKEIFIGHTPVTRIGETVPINKANIWNVDTGAAFKGPLTILDIDTKQFWQSDPVYQLYPEENGRN